MKYFTYIALLYIIFLLTCNQSKSEELILADSLSPVPVYTLECSGNVINGVVTDMPEDNNIRSNLSEIKFNTDSSYNYQFQFKSFVKGSSKSTNWTLNILDPTQDARAVITFIDGKGNDTTITVVYSTLKLKIRPALIDFGLLKSGTEKYKDFWIINTSNIEAKIFRLYLNSNNIFNLEFWGKYLPIKIQKNDSVGFSVHIWEYYDGFYTDSIGVGDSCHYSNQTLVKGEIRSPVIFTEDVNFDTTTIHKTKTSYFSIFNEGIVPLLIVDYKDYWTYPNNFKNNLPRKGINDPVSIPAKEGKTFEIEFTPTRVGDFLDSIIVISDAGENRKNICYIHAVSQKAKIDNIDNENNLNTSSLVISSIFPEPSDGLVTIETNIENENGEMEILDIKGRTIKSMNMNISKSNRFDFSDLSDGVYILNLKVGKENISKKFTIKR